MAREATDPGWPELIGVILSREEAANAALLADTALQGCHAGAVPTVRVNKPDGTTAKYILALTIEP